MRFKLGEQKGVNRCSHAVHGSWLRNGPGDGFAEGPEFTLFGRDLRRFKLGHGRAFALYVAAYTVGRFWIEDLRIDTANHFLGLRLNDWTSIVVFIGAVTYFVISAKLRPGREVVDRGVPAESSNEEEVTA